MLLQFERDPTFRLDDSYDLTKDQQRERVMTRVRSPCAFPHGLLMALHGVIAQQHDPVCQQRVAQ